MKWILLYLIIINLIAYGAMGIDKRRAVKNKRRIPEKLNIEYCKLPKDRNVIITDQGTDESQKNCKKDSESCAVTWIFLVMFIAYTSQACFNSSVVNTTPYFWAVIGMVMTKDIQKPLGYRKKIKEIKLLSRNEV